MRRRHAHYFADWAAQAERQLYGSEQVFWLACLERNIGNLRAALTWLLQTGEVVQAARMACALALFWQRHGHYHEGRQWLHQVLVALEWATVSPGLRAETLQAAATLAYRQGDWLVAQRWLAESLALFDDLGDRPGAARVLFDQGWIAIDQAAWGEALRLNSASLALAEQAGDTVAVYRALTNLGWTHLCMGEPPAAAPYFAAAYEHAQAAGDTRGIAVSLANLAWIAHYCDDAPQIETLAQASLRLCCQLGERELEAECLELLAIAAIGRQDARRAAVLSGAAEALRAALHILHPATQHAAIAHAAAVEAMRRALPAEEFAAAWAQGRCLRLEAMVVFALGCERKRKANVSTQNRRGAEMLRRE